MSPSGSVSPVSDVRAHQPDTAVESVFDRVVARVRDSASRFDAVRAEEFRRATEVIATIVRDVAGGRAPHAPAISKNAPGRRILEAIRKELVNDMAAPREPSPHDAAARATEAFSLLCAIEAVQDSLDGDAAQRFVSRLSGPDALQLLVEVSHDMRSPLNAILFLADQVRNGRGGALNSIQERQLALVHNAAFGLSAMVSDVIELAHAGDRLVEGPPAAFSLSTVLDGVHAIVRPLAEEKSLAIELTPPEADLRLGHSVALSRVLLNLTTNALKFTEQGSVSITCTSKSRTVVEFAVKDTGRGIPPAVLATLFDAFRQHHLGGEFVFSSAGLGLSICQRLVRGMGGEIVVDTELGVGTRFSFELDLPIASRIAAPLW